MVLGPATYSKAPRLTFTGRLMGGGGVGGWEVCVCVGGEAFGGQKRLAKFWTFVWGIWGKNWQNDAFQCKTSMFSVVTNPKQISYRKY